MKIATWMGWGLVIAALGCSGASKRSTAPNYSHSFAFHVEGVKGHPGHIPNNWAASMRKLVPSIDGVIKESVTVLQPTDLKYNAVHLAYEPSRISPAQIVSRVRESWDISWYACDCGKYAPLERDCCGKAMRKAE